MNRGNASSSLAKICVVVVKSGELCDEMMRGAGEKDKMARGSGVRKGRLCIYCEFLRGGRKIFCIDTKHRFSLEELTTP